MEPIQLARTLRRRDFISSAAGGVGMAALANLLAEEGRTAEAPIINPFEPKKPHFAPAAKNIIFLYMEGAPSQIDLCDPKPELMKWHGQPLPPSMTKDLKFAFIKPNAKVLGCNRPFAKHGQSGAEFSDWLDAWKPIADDLCVVRSMHTDAVNHQPADMILFTGHMLPGRPTLGSWILYGLGSESRNLPGFIVLSTGKNNMSQSAQWSSGFLPSNHQGVLFRRTGDPVLYVSNPEGVSREDQRRDFELVAALNRERFGKTGDMEIASRISSYEMAFRMQMSTPELLDVAKEPAGMRTLYGLEEETTRAFGTNCLLARRMIERGVRVVMVTHSSWDQHTDLQKDLKKNCDITAGPIAALIQDLKQRGMLDSTLVVWGGEFGRTPLGDFRNGEEATAGRDHHASCFTMWLAGGGIKSGITIGKTDDLGMKVIEDPVHVNDLQATILHCLGFDHTRLTYRHMGRDFRLTDVQGEVIRKMIV
ncbi:MAG TPA: DUF1501 domain-containing protein [Bryobacteraceae bacterium]|nr:DUF1501 domain-containing protein [Bryobacteraceae bacterium]